VTPAKGGAGMVDSRRPGRGASRPSSQQNSGGFTHGKKNAPRLTARSERGGALMRVGGSNLGQTFRKS